MLFDPTTTKLLQRAGRRMNHALHVTTPPDRKEAAKIQLEVDAILDARPRTHVIAPDGEVIWANASPLVWDQATPLIPGVTLVFNNSKNVETVTSGRDDPPEPNGGGVGLMERPRP